MINSGTYSPMTQYEMQFTPLLPSQLLMGSPFQPGTPAISQFGSFPGSATPVFAQHSDQYSASYLPQQYYTSSIDLENRPRTVSHVYKISKRNKKNYRGLYTNVLTFLGISWEYSR